MVQRYETYGYDWELEVFECDSGNLVSYEDYAKLEAELQKYKDQYPDYYECPNCGSVTHMGGVEPDEKKPAWVVWCGGENPVPGKRVDVKYRCEYISYDTDSNLYRWRHADAKQDSDIIAYRVVEQNDTRN